jgi:DNA primase
MILKEGMNPRVVFLPDGDDPDSYSRKHTLEEIQEFIDTHEQDGIAFKTDLLLSEAGDDPLKKAGLINEIADTVADIPDAIKRQVYVDTVARKFGIEADIIQERVAKTRDKNAREAGAAKMREEAREKREQQAAGHDDRAAERKETPLQALTGNQITDPSERELLSFILRSGQDPLNFETDSEFYNPEGAQTVAEFIDDALAADDTVFSNTAYQATYDAYFELYDKGLPQDDIILQLLNGEDRTVATVAADISTQKYELTVHNFSDALTTHESWLTNFVPRAILAYHEKRITLMQNNLMRELAEATPERQNQIMASLSRLSEMKKTINSKLGREKK